MTRNGRACAGCILPKLLDYKPERLVVSGFRCCMAGYEFGDIECWETGWRYYVGELGSGEARTLMGELQYWVRSVRGESRRRIACFPHGCQNVCHDECMALSMISGMQDGRRDLAAVCRKPSPRRCQRNGAPERVSDAAAGYATALKNLGLKLLPVPEDVIRSIAFQDGSGMPGPRTSTDPLHPAPPKTKGNIMIRPPILALLATTALTISAAWSIARGDEVSASSVTSHYGDVALAMYSDAHGAAVDLQKAVDALIAKPTDETLAAARKAWKDSRPWYQQTEGLRFGNAIVDDWEGRVNAWPLDEGLIDYVDGKSYGDTSDENPLYHRQCDRRDLDPHRQ